MNKTFITVGSIIVAIALFFVGRVTAPTETVFGSYTPPIQSSSGFSQSLTTSTSFAASSFCSQTNIQFTGTTAPATGTFAAATTTYVACASPAFGASVEGLMVNDSTNTVNLIAGTGTTFQCETSDVGTSTISSGACTSSQVTIPATSTMYFSSYFDGASSTLKVIVGNTWH